MGLEPTHFIPEISRLTQDAFSNLATVAPLSIVRQNYVSNDGRTFGYYTIAVVEHLLVLHRLCYTERI